MLTDRVAVIMSGTGRMTCNDETFEVQQYDIIFCGAGEGRGLYNSDSRKELELFKVGVSLLEAPW